MTNPYFAARALADADDRPQLVFVAGADRTALSMGAFWRAVEGEAARLAGLGARPGEVVLIFALNSPRALVGFFACQRLGAIPSLMPPPSPRQPLDSYLATHRALVARIEPSLILADAPRAEELAAAFARPVAPLREPAGGPDAPLADMPLPPPEATALLQHSSGTTGLKKGVMLDYAVLARHLAALEALAEVGPDTTIVSWLPLYHDMGLIACTLLPVVRRRKLVLMDTFAWLADPLRILRLAAEEPAAVLWLPNFAFNHLANQARRLRAPIDLSRVAIVNSSEPCKPASMARFHAAFASHGLARAAIKCCYGMAENVYAVTQTPAGRPPRTLFLDRASHEAGRVTVAGAGEIGADAPPPPPGTLAFASCGTPIGGTQMAIRRADGSPAAPDEVGRIVLKGASLFGGYYGEPGLTAERFAEGWFDTADLGFLHAGELYICGRIDDLIIVHGKNLLAHDIEESVGGIAGVKPGRCSAFGCEDERTGSELLVVAAEVPEEDDAARVREAIHAAVFGEFGVSPADIVLAPLDTLRKTTSGKMSRGENKARYLAGTLSSWRQDAA